MPPQRVPVPSSDRNGAVDALPERLLVEMDSQQRVEESSRLVTDFVANSSKPDTILASLAHAMLREDSTFHHFQIVDAAIKQYEYRKGDESARHCLVAMARFLAAHYPTPRAVNQTYNIAVRLQRGDEIFSEG